MADYELRAFSLPVELEEVLTAELWSLGALGFEVKEAEPGRVRLDAYFPSPLPLALADFDFSSWRQRGAERLARESLADRDWLAGYRAAARPFDVGRRFRVDPRDPPGETPGGERITLQIPARTAFGTGSHASTRLVLGWIEDLDLSRCSILDVGTGSGILAFAAERLGAARVVGCDVDAQAVCIARANARRSGLAPGLLAGGVAALAETVRFDLVLVNILPERFAHEVARLVALLAPSGRLISSGNLASRRDELLGCWADHGLALAGERRDGDWVAFLLRRPDRAGDAGDLPRGQKDDREGRKGSIA